MNKVNVELSDRDLDLLLAALESHMESWDAYRIKDDLSILTLRFQAFQQQMHHGSVKQAWELEVGLWDESLGPVEWQP